MYPALTQFFARLDQCTEQVPLELLADGLKQLQISLDDVKGFAHFGRERYQRNMMYAGKTFEALLLCWQSGQRSPIHDHRGSNCAFRVIEGTAAETRFERTAEGLIYPLATAYLPPGTLCATVDDDIHQVSNLQSPGTPLVTLHLYSPGLRVCNVYSLTDSGSQEWHDPVFEFAEGSGI